jgi:heptosyltransferase-2
MKILVMQKMIGDVLVGSIICNNPTRLPNAKIDYLVYESTSPVLEGNQILIRLFVLKSIEKQKNY